VASGWIMETNFLPSGWWSFITGLLKMMMP
jgi:hypothetical protein